jgi:hypothetical protein
MSQILVHAVTANKEPAVAECRSTAGFLVYCSTDHDLTGADFGYLVWVESTHAQFGIRAPAFVVGGVANDVVTIQVNQGRGAFITLQTQCGATASISSDSDPGREGIEALIVKLP